WGSGRPGLGPETGLDRRGGRGRWQRRRAASGWVAARAGERRRPSRPSGAVDVDGHPPAVLGQQAPAVVVEQAVVEAAEHRAVAGAGRAAPAAVVQVVDVAVPWRTTAAGE